MIRMEGFRFFVVSFSFFCCCCCFLFLIFVLFFGDQNHTAKAQNPPIIVDAQSKCRCSFIKPPARGPMNALEQVCLN